MHKEELQRKLIDNIDEDNKKLEYIFEDIKKKNLQLEEENKRKFE